VTEKVYQLWDQRPVRRAIWALALALFAVGVIAFVRSRQPEQVTYRGGAPQHVFKDTGAQFGRKIRFTGQVRAVAKQFIHDGVLRNDPMAARALVGPKLRNAVSDADWAAGTLPIPQFPPKYFSGAGYHVLRARERQVLVDVGIASTAPNTVKGFDFVLELRPLGGHWRVISATPRNSTPVPSAS
jgi:hypothetical protein